MLIVIHLFPIFIALKTEDRRIWRTLQVCIKYQVEKPNRINLLLFLFPISFAIKSKKKKKNQTNLHNSQSA